MNTIKTYRTAIFLLFFLCFLCCTSSQPNICIKDGKEYCTSPDWIYVIDWDSCYRRGVSCIEGKCWENAIVEFRQAMDFLYEDTRDARPYGMHFRDYFPHREMGICYYHLGDNEEAIKQLEISMHQAPSARAKYYLNQARKSYLMKTGIDSLPPVIHLEFSEKKSLTNQTPFYLKGTVKDDQYVASISINQAPLFIELAKPSISFTHPIHLHEGCNIINVAVTDLAERKTEEVIRIYLDQQGPTVIAKPIRPDQTMGISQVLLSAFVYDKSGIASFEVNQKEVLISSQDKNLFIEEYVAYPTGLEDIPFKVKDRAGNITEGEVALIPHRRRVVNLSKRLASNDPKMNGIQFDDTAGIIFDIKKPPEKDSETYYREIFLEGKIESRNGIRMVKLNDLSLFNMSEILAETEEKKQRSKYSARIVNRIYEIVQKYNIYFINRRIPIDNELTKLELLVKDHMGNTDKKEYIIKKIPRSRIFESEQQMLLAILPFDSLGENIHDPELIGYISKTIFKSFEHQERFDLISQDMLPWHMIDKACKDRQTCDKHLILNIAKSTNADGVICGHIKRWLSGMEIKAEFRDTDKGNNCLIHDVFTPTATPQDLKSILSGLAMKFRDSFPKCDGRIIDKEGHIIYVNIGEESKIFPGMRYNVYKEEKKLITKASIRDVTYKGSEAKIDERKKIKKVEKGDYVRTR